MNDSLSDIVAALKKAGTVLISVHKNPDGDALGSQIGLMIALEKLGKKVTAHNLDPVPEIYRFLPHADRVKTGRPVQGAYDALVVLDSDPPRTGLFDDGYPAKTLINVDHHRTNARIWPLTWLDPDASATGEMIYTMVTRLGVPLDREIALCLYTAIFTDTGSYRYSNTTAKCMRISADLLDTGADPWLVTENVYESFAYKRIKFLGQVLTDMARSGDGRVAWVVITDELYRASGTSAEDTENFINFVRSVKGVEVAVLFRQTAPAQYKVSFRSKGRADVAVVATMFGGGGHKNAAGCVVEGTAAEIIGTVIGAVSRSLQPSRKS